MSGLQELQLRMKKGEGPSDTRSFVLGRLFPEYVTEDAYGTLALASKKDGPHYTIDPNDLLVEGIEETISNGYEFFQLIGLAIKNGANPNLYVTVSIMVEVNTSEGIEQRDDITVMHVLAYAWRLYLEKGYDYKMLLSIVGLLCAAGSDAKMDVVDRDVLLERKRRQAKNPACVSAVEVISEVKEVRSVINLIASSLEIPNRKGEELEGYADDYLTTAVLRYIAIFTAFRGTLSDVANITGDDYFTVSDLQLMVPLRQADRLAAIDLASQIGEALDDPSHMVGDEGLDKLLSCLDLHANRCADLILASKMITMEEAEYAFFEALDSYNGRGVILLVDNAFIPKYNHIDRILFKAAEKKDAGLPISAELLTGMLISLVERGSSLDHPQMKVAGIISKAVFDKVSEIQDEPYWQRVCRTSGDYVRADLRQLARQIDLDPQLNKRALCEEFGNIASIKTSELKKVSRKLQEEKMETDGLSLGDLIETKSSTGRLKRGAASPSRSPSTSGVPSLPSGERRQTLPKAKSPARVPLSDEAECKLRDREANNNQICVNADQLTRPPHTYAKLDIHRIRDQVNGLTYCIESIDYPTVLRTKTNEYTGSRLTVQDLEAIRSKYRTITDLGLPLESGSIEEGLKRLKGQGDVKDYEIYVRMRRDAFFALLNSPEIGISTDLFKFEPEDGGLTIEDMSDSINRIQSEVYGSPDDDAIRVVMTPYGNREHAIRTYAMTFMEMIEEANFRAKGYGWTRDLDADPEEQQAIAEETLQMVFESLIRNL